MKQKSLMMNVLMACLVISAVSSHGWTGNSGGNNSWGKSGDDGCCALSTIRVIGTGRIEVTPDIATIYVSITQEATTASEALRKVQAILNSIDSVLKQNRVSKSDIKTSYISVYPKYDFSSGTGVVVGYTVYLSLTITLRDIDKDPSKVGNVIEGLAMAGVSSVSSIQFDSSQP